MAITSGIAISFRSQIMLGEHDLDTDSIKLALYTNAASLSDGTTTYTTSNEVVGTGYSAGGVVLTGIDVTTDSSVAVVSITDAVVTASTITARGALIYNSSKSDKAIAVFDFGADKSSTAGDFTIQFPAAAAATATEGMLPPPTERASPCSPGWCSPGAPRTRSPVRSSLTSLPRPPSNSSRCPRGSNCNYRW